MFATLIYILYYTLAAEIIFFVFIGQPHWDGIFVAAYNYCQEDVVAYGYLYFIIGEFVISFLPLLLYGRHDTKKERVPKPNNVALLIPCHKAEEVIGKTLDAALTVFDGKDIFVIDNGNSPQPLDQTHKVCLDHGVNYHWLPVGSKPKAIFTGVQLTSAYDFVLQIDDDVYLDPDMSFPIDDETHILAYTIGVDTSPDPSNLLYRFQDMEYKRSGITKAYKGYFGSPMFPHGAISLWRRDTLLDVLNNHPLFPISDDWFSGYTANRLGYRIQVCERTFLKTDVPSTLFATDNRASGYGNITLFSQRAYRWYVLKQVQWFYTAYYILFVWKMPSLRVLLVQKVFFFIDLLRIIFTTFKYMFFVIYLYIDWQFSLFISAVYLLMSILTTIVFNYRNLEKHERFPLSATVLWSFYVLYDTFVYLLAQIYAFLYVNPYVFANRRERPVNVSDYVAVNTPIRYQTEPYEVQQ